MPLLESIETVKEDIAGVLQVGSEQVPLSQKELLLFGILRLILGGLGGTGGGEGGSVTIDNEALAGAIANALELKTLTVSGDTVNEAVLATAIASNTQPISVSSLPLPSGAATSAKQPALGTAGSPSTDVLSVQGVSSGSPISFASISKRVFANFTRPADTAAYAAGDAMGSSTSTPTILAFANSARVSGGTGMITKARLVKNSTNTTNAAFRLWLFSSSPTGANDNAAFALSYSSASNRLGYIDFPGFVTEGAGSDCTECEVIGLSAQFYAVATSLFGVLVARSAYVPTSGEQFFVELALEQN